MILSAAGGFPPDIRVEKEARSLVDAGFEVAVLAKRAHSDQPSKERLDYGLEIYRTDFVKPNFVMRQLESITLNNKKWSKAIETFIDTYKPDVLHVHDLPDVPAVLRISRKYKIPVIADLHENMPAAFVAYRSGKSVLEKILSVLVNNYYLWRWREKHALWKCSRIIVVVPEATDRLLRDYKIPSDKITIVSNTEDESTFDALKVDHCIVDSFRDQWIASYIGGIGPHRGIDTSIYAAALVGREIPNFKLVIVGFSSEAMKKKIIKLAEKANAMEYLELVSWVPADQISSYVAASQVCLVPHNDFEHTQTTVPHKLFQYMMSKKPVIVSNCKPLKRVVGEAGCGLVYKANDSKDMARCFIELYQGGSEKMQQYGEQGFAAATSVFSWKKDSARLVEMYNELLNTE